VSANFLDKSGLTAGGDLHTYFTVAPPPAPPVPIPVPGTPHVVASGHFAPSKFWRVAHSVTTDALATLQNSWAMLLVPHVFVPAGPPHPVAESVNLAAIVLTSSAAPTMSVSSVTGEGTALCTALVACVGLNLDCGDVPSVSGDINLNSVKTSPSLGDYLAAIVGAALNMLFTWKVGGAIAKELERDGLAKLEQDLFAMGLALVQTVLDTINSVVSFVNDPVAMVIGWVSSLVQKGADAVKGS
jgi:hypothetical protein